MSADRQARLAPDAISIKLAFGELLEDVGGQAKASQLLAERGIRRSQTLLSNYANANVAIFAPIDVVEALETLARNPRVTRILSLRAGHVMVAMPATGAISPADLPMAIVRQGKEMGELTAKLFAALADGSVCARDVRDHRLVAEADEVMEATAVLRAMLIALEGEG